MFFSVVLIEINTEKGVIVEISKTKVGLLQNPNKVFDI